MGSTSRSSVAPISSFLSSLGWSSLLDTSDIVDPNANYSVPSPPKTARRHNSQHRHQRLLHSSGTGSLHEDGSQTERLGDSRKTMLPNILSSAGFKSRGNTSEGVDILFPEDDENNSGSDDSWFGSSEDNFQSRRKKEKAKSPKAKADEKKKKKQKELESKAPRKLRSRRAAEWFHVKVMAKEQLEKVLLRGHVPLDQWTGRDRTKTVSFLFSELMSQVCALQVNFRGEVRRHMRLAKVKSLRGSDVLIETHQKTESGEMKPTWQLVSIKIRNGEEPREAAIRAMKTILGIDRPKISFRSEVHHETKFAPSFPGLPSYSEYYTFDGDVYDEDLPSEPFETQSGKIVHCWQWVSRSEWVEIAQHRRSKLEGGDFDIDISIKNAPSEEPHPDSPDSSQSSLDSSSGPFSPRRIITINKKKKEENSAAELTAAQQSARHRWELENAERKRKDWLKKNSSFEKERIRKKKKKEYCHLLFDKLDIDGNGRIDTVVLHALFGKLGFSVPLTHIRLNILPAIDPTATGQIGIDQFTKAMELSGCLPQLVHVHTNDLPKSLSEQNLQEINIMAKSFRIRREISRIIFSLIDMDGGGTVNVDEIRQALSHMTAENQERMQSLVVACEAYSKANSELELDLEDFINLINQIKISFI